MMKSDEDFLYVLSCWIILTPIVQYTSESDQDANCIFFQCSHVFICHRLVLLLFFGITGLIAALCLVGLFSYLIFICLICLRKAVCISAQVNSYILTLTRLCIFQNQLFLLLTRIFSCFLILTQLLWLLHTTLNPSKSVCPQPSAQVASLDALSPLRSITHKSNGEAYLHSDCYNKWTGRESFYPPIAVGRFGSKVISWRDDALAFWKEICS